MKPISRLFAPAMLSFALAAALSPMPANAYQEPRLQETIQLFRHASDSNAVEKTAGEFQAMLEAAPADPLLMAYAGASTTRLATTTIFPWKKMHYAEDGLAMLDKALQLSAQAANAMHGNVPVQLEVKFVAANTFLAVPGFMNRAARGQKLIQDILNAPQYVQCPPDFRSAVALFAARLAIGQKHTGEARQHLQTVIQNGGDQKAEAEQLLKGLPS